MGEEERAKRGVKEEAGAEEGTGREVLRDEKRELGMAEAMTTDPP